MIALTRSVDLTIDRAHRRVILGSSLGTLFEWYDFFLYGSLATTISKQFFAGVNETTGFIFALLTFAAGFAVRPLGAVIFGSLGDRVGRKKTFLATIVLMGSATALVGLLPTYAMAGVAAPIALVGLRMLQGLALGGEYGGAAIYVAEHAPANRCGLYTSWIQTTATLGLLLSLLVILLCRAALGSAFESWGWRIPFLVSVALLGLSIYIRLQLAESPVFEAMVAEGTRSEAPLLESFSRWHNLRLILLALFGATAGMTVIFYCSQFYALFFLTQVLKVDAQPANLLVAGALAIGAPCYLVFGALSDRVGRKKVVVLGCVLAAATYFAIFHGITHFANPALESASQHAPVTVLADTRGCSFQFDPLGQKRFAHSCDIAKSALARAGVPYLIQAEAPGTVATVRVRGARDALIRSFEAERMSSGEFTRASATFAAVLGTALRQAGYPSRADPARINYPMVLLLLVLLVVYVTIAYSPVAAWLVELFPPRIRYTAMSVPYHLGVGWIGGLLPTFAFSIVAITGDIYSGLWYPVLVALSSALVGALFLPDVRRSARQQEVVDASAPGAS